MMKPQKQYRTDFHHDKRILGQFYGTNNGPTVIIFAGIHGNEKAGVHASDKVIQKIKERHVKFKGNLHIILGNINALRKNVRFEKVDLNRIWQKDHIEDLETRGGDFTAEEREQWDILNIIRYILISHFCIFI